MALLTPRAVQDPSGQGVAETDGTGVSSPPAAPVFNVPAGSSSRSSVRRARAPMAGGSTSAQSCPLASTPGGGRLTATDSPGPPAASTSPAGRPDRRTADASRSHPTPPGTGGLVAALASLALLGAAVAPAAAKDPGPPQLPAISGLVVDACSGLPITGGLEVTVVGADGAGIHPPNPNRLGRSASRPSTRASISCWSRPPGYGPLGTVDPATGATPGVPVLRDPGPENFPAGQSFSEGLVLAIGLVPETPPNPCRPPNPNLPALAGRGTDAATGAGLRGLTVGLDAGRPSGATPARSSRPPSGRSSASSRSAPRPRA